MRNNILKVVTALILGIANLHSLSGQSIPQGISYQAVAINTETKHVAGMNIENTYWSNKKIKVRFTLLDKYPGGIPQLAEIHETETDDFGIFNLVIGTGEKIFGDFSTVSWSQGQVHLKIEIDFKNNNIYKVVGIEKLWSVPYALVAGFANNTTMDTSFPRVTSKALAEMNNTIGSMNNTIGAMNQQLEQARESQNLHADSDFDMDASNEIQNLQLTGDTLAIDKANFVVLNIPDKDPTNEIQSLRKTSDSLFISKANGIRLLDDDATNEIQNLQLTGDTLAIDKANFVVLNIPDKDPTNEIQSLRKTSDSLFISKANGIRLLDDDATNEIQNLQLTGDTLAIDKANFVVLNIPDKDPTNEIQSLRKTSDSLFISKANGIRLLDDDATNEIQNLQLTGDTLAIDKANFVVLNIPDKDPTNEIQSLRKSSDSLFISKANGIRLLDDDSTNEIQNIFIRNDSLFITKIAFGIPLSSINNNRNPHAFDTLIYSNELADTIYTSYEFLPTNRDADLKSTFVDNWYKSVVVGDSLYFMGHYYNWSNNTFKVYVQMVNLNNLDAIKITTVDSISGNIQSDAKQFHGLLKTNDTQFYWTFQDSIFLYNPLTKKSNSLFIGFSNNFKDIAFDLYFNSFQKKVSGSDYILSGDTVVFCRQRLNPNFPIGSSNFYIDTLSFFELDLNQRKETRIHDVKMEVLLSNGTKSRFDFSKVNIPGLISRNTYAIFTNYVYLENVLQPFYGLTLINPHAKTNNTYKINRASISTSGIIASPGILSKVPCKKDLYYAPGGVINNSESKYFNSVLGGLIEPTSSTNSYTPISFSRTVPWNDKHIVIKGFVPGYSTSNIISIIPDNNCRTDE